jgi:hypothetical protein
MTVILDDDVVVRKLIDNIMSMAFDDERYAGLYVLDNGQVFAYIKDTLAKCNAELVYGTDVPACIHFEKDDDMVECILRYG